MAQGAQKRSQGPKPKPAFELEPLDFIVEFPPAQLITGLQNVRNLAKTLRDELPISVKPIVGKRVNGEIVDRVDLVAAQVMDPVQLRGVAALEQWADRFKNGELKKAEKKLREAVSGVVETPGEDGAK